MARLVWRFMRARRLRSLLSVLSIALGVGLLAALVTLSASMDRALDQQLAHRYGTYDLMVGYRKAGLRLSEGDLASIAAQPGVADVAGIIMPYMGEPHPELKPGLNYYGVPDTPLGRQFVPLAEGTFPAAGEVAVSSHWAKREGLQLGDQLRLPYPPLGERLVRISGLAAIDAQVGVGLAYFERGWLQEATGRSGATFALVTTGKGTDRQRLVSSLQRQFPDLEYDIRTGLDELRQNLSAVRPIALGLGAATLVACAFLLTASFQMALAERSRELALMRAVGATPGQLRRLVLVEGLILGSLGSMLGALLGIGAALLLSKQVAGMLQVEAAAPVVPLAQVAALVPMGLLLALLSALRVARSAGRSDPLQVLRPDLSAQEGEAQRGGRLGLVLAGLGLVVAGTTPLVPDSPLGGAIPALTGSTGALAIALGLLLAAPRLLPWMLPALALPIAQWSETPLAVRGLLRHRRRSGLTMGAMGIGLVLVIALSTFSSSLVGRWHEQVRLEHPADIQLEVPRVYRVGVARDLAERVRTVEGVTAVGDQVLGLLVDYDWSRADPTYLKEMKEFEARSGHPAFRQRDVFWLNPADLPNLVKVGAYRVVEGDLGVWGDGRLAVKQRTAERMGLRVGDRLRLNVSPDGPFAALASPEAHEYTVAAILASDSWRMPDAVIGSTPAGASDRLRMVYANVAPAQLSEARAQVRALVGGIGYSLAAYSDAETAAAKLREWTGQRLALLVSVGVIMAAVAALSLVNAVANSVNERRREYALLRAVGATPVQARNVVLLEAGLLGVAGGLVGTLGGVALGAGALWGLDLPLTEVRLPWGVVAGGLVVSLALALLAAAGPARQVLRQSPAEAVRQG